jgi:type II secretory pathway component PulM
MNQIISRAWQIIGYSEGQRTVVTVCLISAIGMAIILLFPAISYYKSNKYNYLEQVDISLWVGNNLQNISNKFLSEKAAKISGELVTEKSLFSLISETSKKGMISRIEQRGSTVVVTIDKARFSDLLSWLSEDLSPYGIDVQRTTISYIDGDTVNAQIIFSK